MDYTDTMKQCGRLLLALALCDILSVPDVSSDKFFIWLRCSRCAGCDYAYYGWSSGTSCEFFASQFLRLSIRYTSSIVCIDKLRHASMLFGTFMQTTCHLQCKASAWLFTLLLLLSESVHPNPGPLEAAAHTPSVQLNLHRQFTPAGGCCLQVCMGCKLPAFASLKAVQLQCINTPSDGHCPFHAISLSLKHQHHLRTPTELIINLIKQEFSNNSTEYMAFGFQSLSAFNTQINQYLASKMYNTAIGDITLLAIANLLSMNVYIVGNPNSASTVINFRACIQPRAIISEDRYVVVHYHTEHYSGVNIKGLLLNPPIPMTSSASAIVEVYRRRL